MENLEKYSDFLIECVGVPEVLVNCITTINGYNLNTLEDVLYYFTGYRAFNQLDEFNEEEEN